MRSGFASRFESLLRTKGAKAVGEAAPGGVRPATAGTQYLSSTAPELALDALKANFASTPRE